MQAPRLSRAELTSNTATYGVDQNGALIYITSVSDGNADAGTQRENITEIGYYYFDASANKWQSVANSSTVENGLTLIGDKVNLGGALTEPVTISSVSPANKLSIKGSGVDAINFGGDTFSLDADNKRVGVGTNAPTQSVDIDGNARFRNTPSVEENAESYRLVLDANGVLSKEASISSFSTFMGSKPRNSSPVKVLPFKIENGYATKIVGTSISSCDWNQIDFTIYFIGTTYQGATLESRKGPTVYLTKDQSVFDDTLDKLAGVNYCYPSGQGHTLLYSNGKITARFHDVVPIRYGRGWLIIYSIDKVKLMN